MPNIKQQKKRVRTSEVDRVENLRFRSTVKTMTRRLEAAVAAGDQEKIAAEHAALQRWIDRAAANGSPTLVSCRSVHHSAPAQAVGST